MTSVDVIEQVGPVPGGVERDPVNPEAGQTCGPLGETQVESEVLWCQPGAGGRAASLLAIWRWEVITLTD